jgi:hypothetical protein
LIFPRKDDVLQAGIRLFSSRRRIMPAGINDSRAFAWPAHVVTGISRARGGSHEQDDISSVFCIADARNPDFVTNNHDYIRQHM